MTGNVILTGGTGLLGRHLLPLLEEDGWRIWVVGRSAPSDASGAHWIQCDLSGDLTALSQALPDKVDAVVHLAQSPYFRDFPGHASHLFRVNVASTQFLLDLAVERSCRHFVYASTGGVYGSVSAPFREDILSATCKPLGMYPASKLCGELLVNAYAGIFTTVNLRFFFIYGRGQEESMLIPRLVRSVKQGEPIQLQGREGLIINPVHVTDAARAVMAALDLQASTSINVAGPDVLSLRSIAQMISEEVGTSPVFDVRPESHASSMEANIERMKRLLVSPRISFKEGIADYCKGLYE